MVLFGALTVSPMKSNTSNIEIFRGTPSQVLKKSTPGSTAIIKEFRLTAAKVTSSRFVEHRKKTMKLSVIAVKKPLQESVHYGVAILKTLIIIIAQSAR